MIPFDSSQRASHFSVFVCQNLMKNGHGKRARQSGAGLFWAIRWPFWPQFLRYELQICFAQLFTLILIYKPSLESIRPKSAILFPKRLQKLTKVAISQNPISPKCHSPKSLLLLHFSTNLSETFRINVNMNFAHTNRGRFFI